MTPNCWLGRRCSARVVSSMREAKEPALLMSNSPVVVEELRNVVAADAERPAAVSCPRSAGVTPVTPAGQPVPAGVQPLRRFCRMTRNEGIIGLAAIWLML